MRPIDADELLKVLDERFESDENIEYLVRSDIVNAPTIDIKISEGIWQHPIYSPSNWYDIPTICSECGHKYTEYVCGYEWEETGDLPNFCPYCGAKMRVETAEELKIRCERRSNEGFRTMC